LLVKEVQEMEEHMPSSVKSEFLDPNNLAEFFLIVSPTEGFWKDGKFKFSISINEEYNMKPPKVKCCTKILHPNISGSSQKGCSIKDYFLNFLFSANGDVCLSLLRLNSIDGTSWLPTRRLKDVMFGINSIFTDLADFSDPLNVEIAEEFQKDSEKTKQKIKQYVELHAR
jgi:ubiquitin-conjugating enzyme E2 F